jgi:hypothetical protein
MNCTFLSEFRIHTVCAFLYLEIFYSSFDSTQGGSQLFFFFFNRYMYRIFLELFAKNHLVFVIEKLQNL